MRYKSVRLLDWFWVEDLTDPLALPQYVGCTFKSEDTLEVTYTTYGVAPSRSPCYEMLGLVAGDRVQIENPPIYGNLYARSASEDLNPGLGPLTLCVLISYPIRP